MSIIYQGSLFSTSCFAACSSRVGDHLLYVLSTPIIVHLDYVGDHLLHMLSTPILFLLAKFHIFIELYILGMSCS